MSRSDAIFCFSSLEEWLVAGRPVLPNGEPDISPYLVKPHIRKHWDPSDHAGFEPVATGVEVYVVDEGEPEDPADDTFAYEPDPPPHSGQPPGCHGLAVYVHSRLKGARCSVLYEGHPNANSPDEKRETWSGCDCFTAQFLQDVCDPPCTGSEDCLRKVQTDYSGEKTWIIEKEDSQFSVPWLANMVRVEENDSTEENVTPGARSCHPDGTDLCEDTECEGLEIETDFFQLSDITSALASGYASASWSPWSSEQSGGAFVAAAHNREDFRESAELGVRVAGVCAGATYRLWFEVLGSDSENDPVPADPLVVEQQATQEDAEAGFMEVLVELPFSEAPDGGSLSVLTDYCGLAVL